MKKFYQMMVVSVVALLCAVSFAACGNKNDNDTNGAYNPANWERGTVTASYTHGELYNLINDGTVKIDDLKGKYIEIEFELVAIDSAGDYFPKFVGRYNEGGMNLATVYCTVYKPYYEFDYKAGDILIATGYLQNDSQDYLYSLNPCDIQKK